MFKSTVNSNNKFCPTFCCMFDNLLILGYTIIIRFCIAVTTYSSEEFCGIIKCLFLNTMYTINDHKLHISKFTCTASKLWNMSIKHMSLQIDLVILFVLASKLKASFFSIKFCTLNETHHVFSGGCDL